MLPLSLQEGTFSGALKAIADAKVPHHPVDALG